MQKLYLIMSCLLVSTSIFAMHERDLNSPSHTTQRVLPIRPQNQHVTLSKKISVALGKENNEINFEALHTDFSSWIAIFVSNPNREESRKMLPRLKDLYSIFRNQTIDPTQQSRLDELGRNITTLEGILIDHNLFF